MKKEITREELSRYRQQISNLVEKLKSLALKAGYSDVIFSGVPAQVYRTCGKATCRCMTGGERHGPYKVVQVWDGSRSRQVTLKLDEGHYYEKAQRYRQQQMNRKEIIELQGQILEAVDKMLERRTIWQKD